jgi:hypothetical protein
VGQFNGRSRAASDFRELRAAQLHGASWPRALARAPKTARSGPNSAAEPGAGGALPGARSRLSPVPPAIPDIQGPDFGPGVPPPPPPHLPGRPALRRGLPTLRAPRFFRSDALLRLPSAPPPAIPQSSRPLLLPRSPLILRQYERKFPRDQS